MQTNCTRDLIVAIRYNAPGISSVDNHAALLSLQPSIVQLYRKWNRNKIIVTNISCYNLYIFRGFFSQTLAMQCNVTIEIIIPLSIKKGTFVN